jgi:hypothetical protein
MASGCTRKSNDTFLGKLKNRVSTVAVMNNKTSVMIIFEYTETLKVESE